MSPGTRMCAGRVTQHSTYKDAASIINWRADHHLIDRDQHHRPAI